jgi:hypothetical protein
VKSAPSAVLGSTVAAVDSRRKPRGTRPGPGSGSTIAHQKSSPVQQVLCHVDRDEPRVEGIEQGLQGQQEGQEP